MICPNCKTELVEVNGRYICSGCGREIPENEVMASEWGESGVVRAGLYGAGTDDVPEEGSAPITDYNASLTETENEEPTVEQVLQTQSVSEPEVVASGPTPASGFYTGDSSSNGSEKLELDSSQQVSNNNEDVVPDIVAPIPVIPDPVPVIPTEAEKSLSHTPEVSVMDSSAEPQNDAGILTPEPEVPVQPVAVQPAPAEPPTQEIPITVPTPEPIQPEIVPEPEPVKPQVVKDMFENTGVAIAPDPGIYTDPSYENPQGAGQPTETATPTNVPMPTIQRTNLIVLISGSVAVLLLLLGGVWGYLALNTKSVVPIPVVEETVTWQELQVVDGGFKISFPGQPEQSEASQEINGVDTTVTGYVYATDDVSYSVSFATLEEAKAKEITADPLTKLPVLVTEIADGQTLTVADKKIGKYYSADAIDFKLTSDTASYQGKLLINGNNYILVMAGSASGQSVEYDKFIKSFNFITKT